MTAPDRPDGAPWRNFYGRRRGKTLRKGQRDLLETRLAALAPGGVGWDENPERDPIDLRALFPEAREVWLEIGFGGGEHLLFQARANPTTGLIGAEPFEAGMAKAVTAISREGLQNIRLYDEDAVALLDWLPAGSLERVDLLFPDPWPKKRHWKRRFVNAANLERIARVLAPDGRFRFATDIADYAAWTREAVAASGRLTATGEPETAPWPDWPGTRYEAKAAKAGRGARYLTFRKAG